MNKMIRTALLLLVLPAMGLQAEQREYRYTGIDGREHPILAYFPEGHEPTDQRPCFIFFHGGGWKSGSLNQGKPFCEYLASRGMVALTADYSMHRRADKGKLNLGDPEAVNAGPELGDGESRKRICVIDGKSVVRWVKRNASELGVAPDKLVASGASAGAHISVLQMMDEQFDNPADPQGIDTQVQAFVLLASAFTLPAKDRTPEVNVFQHVAKPFPPSLFISGQRDSWAPAAQELAARLDARSEGDIQFWIAPEMGHMFFRTSPDWYTVTKLRIDRFLRDQGFLAGEPAPEALGDAAQLLRIEL